MKQYLKYILQEINSQLERNKDGVFVWFYLLTLVLTVFAAMWFDAPILIGFWMFGALLFGFYLTFYYFILKPAMKKYQRDKSRAQNG